ncbi:MAG: aminotransferase class V-fold PLP-dependent enzyme [Verrucomicrobiota bacterium]
MTISEILENETTRNQLFPVTQDRTFMAHAGVTALPATAGEALTRYAHEGCRQQQEHAGVWREMTETRQEAAKLLEASPDEIALLGPTALGLNLVANGINWNKGDQVIFYQDDYPANVYPWLKLSRLGVEPVALEPEQTGVITWDVLQEKLTDRTRLVSLASASFLSGYRIDIETIGRKLKETHPHILLCIDGIQTLGAFKTTVEYVDFLSADSHKWLLGPMGAGIFYVKESNFKLLEPTLLGSWNVVSPQFIAQESIDFYPGGRRYEPGSLNLPGNSAMLASMKFLNALGTEALSTRIRQLGESIIAKMNAIGFQRYIDFALQEDQGHETTCGIYTFCHPQIDTPSMESIFKKLQAEHIDISLRYNRKNTALFRISPHFYNTEEEIEKVVACIQKAL